MPTAAVNRSVEPPRRRGIAFLGGLAAVLGLGTAVGVAAAIGAGLQEAPPPPQVSVSAPAVTVAAPPIVVAPVAVPPPPAPEPPPPPAPPRPRATRPFINADCVIVPAERPPSLACNWDDGLPAVSADGTRVAMRYTVGPEQSEYSSLFVRVLDVRTSRVVRDILIHTEEEQMAMDEVEVPAVRARVNKRAAAAQRLLDAGGYRTLDALGDVSWSGEQNDLDRTVVHAEIAEDLVRAIDPATGRVLWQHRFSVPRPRGGDPDDDCSGFGLHGSEVWWDPTTRVVLVTQAYATGGCMCGVYTYQHVKRMR